MSAPAPPQTDTAPVDAGMPPLLAAVAGWAVFLPLGIQVFVYLLMGLAALRVLWRSGLAGRLPREPLLLGAFSFWGWLAVSALWSAAPARAIVAHLWSYSLLLWVTPIAAAFRAEPADRGLRHFVLAASLVSLLLVVDDTGLVIALTGRPLADAVTGNQRIAYSLLLALAAALAMLRALDVPGGRGRWAAAALLCAAGLASQDRRSGMLVLPLLLLAMALVRTRGWSRRAGMVALVITATVLACAPLPGVQQRFAEGLSELRAYRSQGDVETSWGMRARMVEVTLSMVAERPLSGHGVGSWATAWRQRVHGGLLEGHTTPHNEYLLVAEQGGLPGLALLAAMFAIAIAGTRRHGRPADGALLVLLTLACAGAFNAVLRDTKFALPLLSLAALSWAAARGPDRATRPAAHPGSGR